MNNAFDKVIGYETIKNELLQICDMIHNKETYEKLGAKLPQGVLLYGDPGLGKTLIAKCFIEESGLEAFTVRRNKSNDDFISNITETFEKAKENAPCIVFLDDMDKFANEDSNHKDAEEYVAVQAGIDEVKNTGVFVFATANNIWKLPQSLKRAGRFDRKIEINCPSDKDACEIIKYYLSSKKVSSDVNMGDLCKMISYSSCASLETILNEAAISAAFARKDCIEMSDIVEAVLRMEYDAPDNTIKVSKDEIRKIALHEAGHAVLSEILCPGSVGLISLRSEGRTSTNGFVLRCKKLKKRSDSALVSLAGKLAVEQYYRGQYDDGCDNDLAIAADIIRKDISKCGIAGINLLDISNNNICLMSETLKANIEAATFSHLEFYMQRVKKILAENKDFLEKLTQALIDKETLLYSDIQAIKKESKINHRVA